MRARPQQHEIFANPRRLLHPQIREDRRTNTWRRVSWDEPLDFIAKRERTVGPEAVGLWAGHGRFTSGQAGQGVIYWAEDGTALFKTASGPSCMAKGQHQFAPSERRGRSCARYDQTGDTVTVIDAASGQIRGQIVKTAAGNAENRRLDGAKRVISAQLRSVAA